MITKNGSAIMSLFAQSGSQNWTFKDKSGNTFNTSVSFGGTFLRKAETSQDEGTWAKLGSGNTEATADDYALAQELSLPCVSASLSVTNGKAIYTYSFVNNTVSDVTVNEMGLFSFISGYYNNHILVARKVVPTRTLAPNETATFSYEIAFN